MQPAPRPPPISSAHCTAEHDSIPSRQVTSYRNLTEPGRGKEPLDGAPLVGTDLHHEPTTRYEVAWRPVDDHPQRVQPVRSGKECLRWFVFGNGPLDHVTAVGDVRWISDDQVE